MSYNYWSMDCIWVFFFRTKLLPVLCHYAPFFRLLCTKKNFLLFYFEDRGKLRKTTGIRGDTSSGLLQ